METSTAARVRKLVLESSDRFWRVEDFPGDAHAVAAQLSRLERAEKLQRVRRGVYWRGRDTPFGVVGPPAVQAVREVLLDDEAIGAAGWYATNLLGLSTQVSPVPVVAVTRRSPTGIRGVRVVDRSNRWRRRAAELNETEVTFLEALEAWDRHVELSPSDALARFVALVQDESVRSSHLADAAPTESSRVRERLRAVLTAAGREKDAEGIAGARSAASKARARQVLPEGVA